MILGSHNSWSFLKPKKWFMRPFAFTARCQEKTIKEQYDLGVRCFDLRFRVKNGKLVFAHGFMVYDMKLYELIDTLAWLNRKGDCYVRVLHEARNKKQYTNESKAMFAHYCDYFELWYPNIIFWNGRNLYNYEEDYKFKAKPQCTELYSSVCKPYLIDDLYPKWYAKRNNKKNIKENQNCEILLIDFVNIQ